jgi:hypothetical protein
MTEVIAPGAHPVMEAAPLQAASDSTPLLIVLREADVISKRGPSCGCRMLSLFVFFLLPVAAVVYVDNSTPSARAATVATGFLAVSLVAFFLYAVLSACFLATFCAHLFARHKAPRRLLASLLLLLLLAAAVLAALLLPGVDYNEYRKPLAAAPLPSDIPYAQVLVGNADSDLSSPGPYVNGVAQVYVGSGVTGEPRSRYAHTDIVGPRPDASRFLSAADPAQDLLAARARYFDVTGDATQPPLTWVVYYPSPDDIATAIGLVVVAPDEYDFRTAAETGYGWLGTHLASHGYVVAVPDPSYIGYGVDGSFRGDLPPAGSTNTATEGFGADSGSDVAFRALQMLQAARTMLRDWAASGISVPTAEKRVASLLKRPADSTDAECPVFLIGHGRGAAGAVAAASMQLTRGPAAAPVSNLDLWLPTDRAASPKDVAAAQLVLPSPALDVRAVVALAPDFGPASLMFRCADTVGCLPLDGLFTFAVDVGLGARPRAWQGADLLGATRLSSSALAYSALGTAGTGADAVGAARWVLQAAQRSVFNTSAPAEVGGFAQWLLSDGLGPMPALRAQTLANTLVLSLLSATADPAGASSPYFSLLRDPRMLFSQSSWNGLGLLGGIEKLGGVRTAYHRSDALPLIRVGSPELDDLCAASIPAGVDAAAVVYRTGSPQAGTRAFGASGDADFTVTLDLAVPLADAFVARFGTPLSAFNFDHVVVAVDAATAAKAGTLSIRAYDADGAPLAPVVDFADLGAPVPASLKAPLFKYPLALAEPTLYGGYEDVVLTTFEIPLSRIVDGKLAAALGIARITISAAGHAPLVSAAALVLDP